MPLTIRYLERLRCPYPIEVVTNTLPIDYPAVTYLGADRGWGNNLLAYLKDKTEPFIMWFEDGIAVYADWELVSLAEQEMQNPGIGLVRLFPCPGPTLPWSEHFGEIDKSLPYAISCQVSIWNPQTIRDILKPDETPWDFEIHGSQRALHYPKTFLSVWREHCAVSYKEYMRRGKLNPDAVEWIEKNP